MVDSPEQLKREDDLADAREEVEERRAAAEHPAGVAGVAIDGLFGIADGLVDEVVALKAERDAATDARRCAEADREQFRRERDRWGAGIVGALTTVGELQPEKPTPEEAARSIHRLAEQRDAANERADANLKACHRERQRAKDAEARLAGASTRADEAEARAEEAMAEVQDRRQERDDALAGIDAAEQRAEEAERASAIWEDKAIAQEQGWNSSIDDRDRLAAALRWVEWNEIGGVMRCPSCWSLKPDHGPCCKLAAALSTTPPSPAKTAPTEGDLAGDETPEPEEKP